MKNDEAITNYLESTLEASSSKGTPIFATSWATQLSHDHLNGIGIQPTDETYADFLRRIDEKGYLKDTILVFLGDHGYRYGKLRETPIGYYEDRLPNLWIRLPPRIKERFPEWQKALEVNSLRPTSPYTMYWTLNKILETFTNVKLSGKALKEVKRRHSFFEELPESQNCEDSGIPQHYCACNLVKETDDKESLTLAAIAATDKLNSDLLNGTDCSELEVKRITAGGIVEINKSVKNYIVGFVTSPGSFRIEASVEYNVKEGTFRVESLESIMRVNSLSSSDTGCVKDSKLELFCYCK
jgi:hypothetical protein